MKKVTVDKNKKPTAINKRGNKVAYKEYIFDSNKEFQFFSTYILNKGYAFDVHPKYNLIDKFDIQGVVNVRSVSYKPDFVIYNEDGSIKHVYDVKNGFSAYDIDTGNNLRFKLFEKKFNIPVEIAVVRKTFFRTKILGTTKKFSPVKVTNIDYDWKDFC